MNEAQEREQNHTSLFMFLLNVQYWKVFRLSRGCGASPEEA